LNVEQRAVPVQIFSNMGMEAMDVDFQNMFEKIMPKSAQARQVPVREARKILLEMETEALIDRAVVSEKAVELAENQDISRQGVQRDLLPVVEGTTVNTKYGSVRTDHILFIAAGAFHVSKPADLMPELQGRFPIRVELTDLTREDFLRILTEPKHALTKQYSELLATEGVTVEFTPDGIETIAEIAYDVNRTTQNIGARRLHTILERVVEEISFEAPDLKHKRLSIDGRYVRDKLDAILQKEDLTRFIL
jgi:ATP-dependent HslUV protease ATP-binding subunit HslU